MDLTLLALLRVIRRSRSSETQADFFIQLSHSIGIFFTHPWGTRKRARMRLNFLTPEMAHPWHSYSRLRMSHKSPPRIRWTGICIWMYGTWMCCEYWHPLVHSQTLFLYLCVLVYAFPGWREKPSNAWTEWLVTRSNLWGNHSLVVPLWDRWAEGCGVTTSHVPALLVLLDFLLFMQNGYLWRRKKA